MKKTHANSDRLDQAQWNLLRHRKAADRAEVRRLVNQGMLTATEANEAASLFRAGDRFGPLDLLGFLDRLSEANLSGRRHGAGR